MTRNEKAPGLTRGNFFMDPVGASPLQDDV